MPDEVITRRTTAIQCRSGYIRLIVPQQVPGAGLSSGLAYLSSTVCRVMPTVSTPRPIALPSSQDRPWMSCPGLRGRRGRRRVLARACMSMARRSPRSVLWTRSRVTVPRSVRDSAARSSWCTCYGSLLPPPEKCWNTLSASITRFTVQMSRAITTPTTSIPSMSETVSVPATHFIVTIHSINTTNDTIARPPSCAEDAHADRGSTTRRSIV